MEPERCRRVIRGAGSSGMSIRARGVRSEPKRGRRVAGALGVSIGTREGISELEE